MGLFAAIPAVIAFNHSYPTSSGLSTRFESFMEEFFQHLARQANAAAAAAGGGHGSGRGNPRT